MELGFVSKDMSLVNVGALKFLEGNPKSVCRGEIWPIDQRKNLAVTINKVLIQEWGWVLSSCRLWVVQSPGWGCGLLQGGRRWKGGLLSQWPDQDKGGRSVRWPGSPVQGGQGGQVVPCSGANKRAETTLKQYGENLALIRVIWFAQAAQTNIFSQGSSTA